MKIISLISALAVVETIKNSKGHLLLCQIDPGVHIIDAWTEIGENFR